MFSNKSLPESKQVFCFGEVLWDGIYAQAFPGGAPLNVASHLLRHQVKTALVSAIGTDPLGDRLAEELTNRGFDLSFLQRSVAPSVVTNAISLKPKTGPSLPEEASFAYILYDEAICEAARCSGVLYFGTAIQFYDTSRQTLYQILEQLSLIEHIVFVDINFRWMRYSRESVVRTMRYADVLKMTLREASQIGELLQLGYSRPEDIIQSLIETYEIPVVFATDGADGSYVFQGECKSIKVPAVEPSSVISDADSLGAGDAFTAGVIFSLLEQYPSIDLEAAACYGSKLGSYAANCRGAMPDYCPYDPPE